MSDVAESYPDLKIVQACDGIDLLESAEGTGESHNDLSSNTDADSEEHLHENEDAHVENDDHSEDADGHTETDAHSEETDVHTDINTGTDAHSDEADLHVDSDSHNEDADHDDHDHCEHSHGDENAQRIIRFRYRTFVTDFPKLTAPMRSSMPKMHRPIREKCRNCSRRQQNLRHRSHHSQW